MINVIKREVYEIVDNGEIIEVFNNFDLAKKFALSLSVNKDFTLCKNCKHPKSYHTFFNQDKGILEIINCNECDCNKFEYSTARGEERDSITHKNNEKLSNPAKVDSLKELRKNEANE